MRTYLFRSKTQPTKPPYHTTIHDDGTIICDCPARVECWHKKDVRERPVTPNVQLSPEDALQLTKLIREGNKEGAMKLANDLFPFISLEDLLMMVDEVELRLHAE